MNLQVGKGTDDAEAAEAEDTSEVNSSPGLEEQQTHNGILTSNNLKYLIAQK